MSPCPICRRSARLRAENGAFPFCSPRCKQIDLGKWLDEGYRVAVADESDTEPEEDAAPRATEEKA